MRKVGDRMRLFALWRKRQNDKMWRLIVVVQDVQTALELHDSWIDQGDKACIKDIRFNRPVDFKMERNCLAALRSLASKEKILDALAQAEMSEGLYDATGDLLIGRKGK